MKSKQLRVIREFEEFQKKLIAMRVNYRIHTRFNCSVLEFVDEDTEDILFFI